MILQVVPDHKAGYFLGVNGGIGVAPFDATKLGGFPVKFVRSKPIEKFDQILTAYGWKNPKIGGETPEKKMDGENNGSKPY